MATIRSQCVDAIVALLNESSGRPAGLLPVERTRLEKHKEAAGLKCIFVRPEKNKTTAVGSIDGPLRQHELEIIVDAIASGDATTPPDVAVDPLIAWVVKKLDGAVLTNLEALVIESEAEYVYEQGDYPLCRASTRFLVIHTTTTGNAELRA